MSRPEGGDETLRTFVAVEVSAEVVTRAAEILEDLRKVGGDVKWVEPRNFHLTLKFLGPTSRSDLPQLSAALGEVASRKEPFGLELAGVGAFPSVRRPDVIWLGVVAGQEPLTQLAAETETACAALGWAPEDRPYRAHLTLGRSRTRDQNPRGRGAAAHPPASSTDRAELTRTLETLRETPACHSPVERVVLMQSELRRGGPIYTVLQSFPLKRSTAEHEQEGRDWPRWPAGL
jgi:2'-5' RNA ligase